MFFIDFPLDRGYNIINPYERGGSEENDLVLNENERILATIQQETIRSFARLRKDVEQLRELHDERYNLVGERYTALPRFSEERVLIDTLAVYFSLLDDVVDEIKKDAPDLLEQIKCNERNKNQ